MTQHKNYTKKQVTPFELKSIVHCDFYANVTYILIKYFMTCVSCKYC